MSNIKLSICIATLNRAAFIGETLESILSQIKTPAEVEVVIVDGASTDGTPDIVRGFQHRYACIHYVRLAQKGGVDRDYAHSVEQAHGEYCWLFSDDDLLKPGAVEAVLATLQQSHDLHDLIVVNAETRGADLAEGIHERQLRKTHDEHYPATSADQERFFAEAAGYLSFIGCVVIKRSLWQARQKEQYFGTEFIHIGVIFQQPLDALILAHPWIIIRYGNASWSGRAFQIWNFKWPELIWSFPHFSEAAKRRIVPRQPWRSAKNFLLGRASDVFDLARYHEWYAPRLTSVREKVLAQVIAICPGVLMNAAAVLYFHLFIPHDQLAQLHLRESKFYYRNWLARKAT